MLLIGPRQVAHSDAIGALGGQRRWLGANLFGLLGDLEPPVDAVHEPGVVHLLQQLAESFWLRSRGVADLARLYDVKDVDGRQPARYKPLSNQDANP